MSTASQAAVTVVALLGLYSPTPPASQQNNKGELKNNQPRSWIMSPGSSCFCSATCLLACCLNA
jgi:hypothetical protein